MKTKLISVLTAMTLVASFAIVSCERDQELDALTSASNVESRAHLQVRLMDAPSPYNFEAANIQIKAVNIYVEPSGRGQRPRWMSLNIRSGIFDMLTLVNGKDMLLADQYIPNGKITQVALVLGPENSVVIGGRSHHLVTDGTSPSVIMRTDFSVTEDAPFLMMLDFDAAQSITKQTDYYRLKPVVHAIDIERTGSIHGKTRIVRGSVAVFADGATGTNRIFSSYASNTGEFLLRGLPSGTYQVRIYYPESDHAETFDNVRVSGNSVTELDSTFP